MTSGKMLLHIANVGNSLQKQSQCLLWSNFQKGHAKIWASLDRMTRMALVSWDDG